MVMTQPIVKDAPSIGETGIQIIVMRNKLL